MLARIVLISAVVCLTGLIGCKKSTPPADTQPPAPAASAAKDTAGAQPAPAEAPAAVPMVQVTPQVAETPAAPEAPTAKLGDAAPGILDLTWVKNGPVEYKKGQVYVIEFWATWCPPCRTSIPHLTEVQKKYADKNVTIIGISDEKLEEVKPFVDEMGDKMAYAVAVDGAKTMGKNYMEAFKIEGIPHAFIIDKNGMIAWQGHPMDNMEAVLDKVLEGTFDIAAYAREQAEKEALEKQLQQWYEAYMTLINDKGPSPEAKDIALKFIDKGHQDALIALAWAICNIDKKENRQADVALLAAEKANKLAEGKVDYVLDILSLALFETGKKQEAIDAVKKAIELTREPEMLGEFEKHLARYEGRELPEEPAPAPAMGPVQGPQPAPAPAPVQ